MNPISRVIPGIVAAVPASLWSADFPAQKGPSPQILPDGIRGGSEIVPGPGVEIRTDRFDETGEQLPAEPLLVGGSTETDPAVVSRYGEQDVMNVLARVREEFAIDDDRIYLMGDTQGGGALHLAEKYPSIWAGVPSLAPALNFFDKHLA